MREPIIIQAGMGVAVSDWHLANAVARLGGLGVVSGTSLDNVFVRRLQNGDQGGHVRRALAAFPLPEVAERLLAKYHVAAKKPDTPYARVPLLTAQPARESVELLVAANFVETFLAKEGHSGLVGINYLEKVQLPHLPSLYGAMLAGVDYVLMGAGIPREIPAVLDHLSHGQDTTYGLFVEGAQPGDDFRLRFSPEEFMGDRLPRALKRPKFLAIIASTTLATLLARKVSPPVDGFVIEAPTAGGHNAPPRGKGQFNSRGEPVYGERDEVDLKTIAALGLPFWLAGSRGSPEDVALALENGAAGVQVGTAFALSRDSGLHAPLREQLVARILSGTLDIFTDPRGSPTGFPFKVARLEGTLSDPEVAAKRTRICDLGYLRDPYRKPDGSLGYRCASEPVDAFVKKGGKIEETVGRLCLCNGMQANIGLGQWQATSERELPLLTLGDNIECVRRLVSRHGPSYGARQVFDFLAQGIHLDRSQGLELEPEL